MSKGNAWIHTVELEQADAALAAAYEKCADPRTGMVAHIMKIHSLNPQSMLDHRALYRTLMYGPSPLKRSQREMIAVVVSTANGCHY
jgi:alkylhydroperoxidase family enzyme